MKNFTRPSRIGRFAPIAISFVFVAGLAFAKDSNQLFDEDLECIARIEILWDAPSNPYVKRTLRLMRNIETYFSTRCPGSLSSDFVNENFKKMADPIITEMRLKGASMNETKRKVVDAYVAETKSVCTGFLDRVEKTKPVADRVLKSRSIGCEAVYAAREAAKEAATSIEVPVSQKNDNNSQFLTSADANSEVSLTSTPTSLFERDGWGLKLLLSKEGDGSIVAGRHEFANLKCGGNFKFERKNDDGAIVLRQSITYGNCIDDCTLVIVKNLSSYHEVCAGKVTGGGNLYRN